MKILAANHLHNTAEYDRRSYFVKVDPDTTIDDILTPRFWAHHVQKLDINARVEVVSVDGKFDLDLRVVDRGVGFVTMRVLRRWERDVADKSIAVPNVSEADIPDGYTVNHAPKTKWRVFTKEPLQEISRDHPTKEHAIAAAMEHAAKATNIAA